MLDKEHEKDIAVEHMKTVFKQIDEDILMVAAGQAELSYMEYPYTQGCTYIGVHL